ncbi:hypothetical protein Q3G72_001702 [Acer saccharum]|nr:hypothetical protein Q3G72_001702 [Acer saccharum]
MWIWLVLGILNHSCIALSLLHCSLRIVTFDTLMFVKILLDFRSILQFCTYCAGGNAHNLFAFHSECNFSSSKFNLDLVNIMKKNPVRILESSPYHEGCWLVLIDAAKRFAMQPPDLSKYPADFVVVSLYKIFALFGYPTGLGTLIIQNGTVAVSIADIDFVRRRQGIEDGSASFLSIASVLHGFNIIDSLTVSAIFRYTKLFAVAVCRLFKS